LKTHRKLEADFDFVNAESARRQPLSAPIHNYGDVFADIFSPQAPGFARATTRQAKIAETTPIFICRPTCLAIAPAFTGRRQVFGT
jgi:hypothetical protein